MTHASRAGHATKTDLIPQHNELSLHNITSFQLNAESKHLVHYKCALNREINTAG